VEDRREFEKSVSYADVYEWLRQVEASGTLGVSFLVTLAFDRKLIQVVPRVTATLYRKKVDGNGQSFIGQAAVTYGRGGEVQTLPAAMLKALLIIDRDVGLDELIG